MLLNKRARGDLPVWRGLQVVYGLGRSESLRLCADVQLGPEVRVEDVSSYHMSLMQSLVQRDYEVEVTAKTRLGISLSRLVKTKSYRGQRHKLRLPVRGQRTHTNSKTQRRLAASRLQLMRLDVSQTNY